MAREVIGSQDNDWRKVVAWADWPGAGGKSIFYQKHMSHHLLPEMSRDWLPQLTNCFLIRHPAEVLPSLDEKYERPRLPDTGYPQQVEIFEFVRKSIGRVSPIIDSRDVLTNPRAILGKLAARLTLSFRKPCSVGRPGCVIRTVSGEALGITRWRRRLAFSPTPQKTNQCPIISAGCTRSVFLTRKAPRAEDHALIGFSAGRAPCH